MAKWRAVLQANDILEMEIRMALTQALMRDDVQEF
jgi:hypothetical protein